MESLNSIKETTDVSLPLFASISINLYLQVAAFHSPQNPVEPFHIPLNLMRADTSLNIIYNITIRVLLLFMPSTAGLKSGTIDWQSTHLAVQRSPLAFQSPSPIIGCLIRMPALGPQSSFFLQRIETCA